MVRHQPRHESADAGFTMIEVLVALVIFGVLASGVALTLTAILSRTRDDQSRALAANLATRVLDRLHAVPANQLPQGTQPSQTYTSDGSTFSVVAATELVAEGGSTATSACDAAGALSARRISVIVTWSGMGSTRPVRADTLRRLGVAELAGAKGTVTTRVTDRAGAPLAGQTVTLLPPGQTFATGPDGCAAFPGLTPGPYAFRLGTPGFVDPSGDPSPSHDVTATAGTVTRDADFSYDRAGSLALTWSSSAPVPTGIGAFLTHPAFTATGSGRAFPSCPSSGPCSTSAAGSGAMIAGLYPSLVGYRAWPGACADAQTTTSPAGLLVAPGGTTTSTVPVPQVMVTISKGPTQTYPATVTASHAADAGCPALSAPLAVSATGAAQAGLPAGTWTFSIPGQTNPGATRTVTVVAGSSTAVALDLNT